jgi:biopolymer transport protein ExbD
MKFAKESELERLEFNMTPMIDVCFQLIIFFMLSMRLFSAEGDFSIQMPSAAPQEGLPDEMQTPPVKVRLRADRKGKLAGIQIGQRAVANFKDLQRQVREISGLDRGPAATAGGAEIELDCDYNLKFEYVVKTLTAVSGFLAEDKQTVVRMVDKIRFAPPRKPKEE